MRFNSLGLLMLILSVASCAHVGAHQGDVTVLDVTRNPGGFDGKRVAINGWAEASHERYRIWSSKADSEDTSVERECVNLGFRVGTQLEQFDQRQLTIAGIFVAKLPPDTIVLSPCGNGHLIIVD
jgi:hypothetical protein